MKREGIFAAFLHVVILSVVIVAAVSFVVHNKTRVGLILLLLAFLPLVPLTVAGRSIQSVGADIIFGAIDTGLLGIAALIGASFAGVLGAIVGGAVGDAITDALAGLFEGKVAESLRKRGIEEARTPLSTSMGKMSGCLLGVGITLTVAWTIIRL